MGLGFQVRGVRRVRAVRYSIPRSDRGLRANLRLRIGGEFRAFRFEGPASRRRIWHQSGLAGRQRRLVGRRIPLDRMSDGGTVGIASRAAWAARSATADNGTPVLGLG